MTKAVHLCLSVLFGLLLNLGAVDDAEAKRMGGGSSFGSRPSHSAPYKRQATPAQVSPARQQAMAQNQVARDGLRNRGGLMGMLGGLAIGGLLGALLFGGAFENLNMMDFLVFGAIAFMLYKLLAARRGTPQPAYQRASSAPTTRPAPSDYTPPPVAAGAAGAAPGESLDTGDWFRRGGSAAATPAGTEDVDFNQALVPADFDQAGFLAGARIAYRDLQRAWDARDLATLRRLATDGMYVELEQRLAELAADNHTAVLKLEAELLEAREAGDQWEAVVLFDAILREEADDQARQVREVWHFTRPRRASQPTWFLDGIQQLED
ncbi:MAG: Tim44 domain-containing protein [Gammaproteobacteria bacterium]